MSHMWKVMVRRGASEPCVQLCVVEVSSSEHGDDHGILRIISPPLGKIRPRIKNLITMETVVVNGLVVGRS